MEKHTTVLQPTDANIVKCAAVLRSGEAIAFPTETVYALGAVATDEAAIKKVYAIKGRPLAKPLIVAVAQKRDIAKVVKEIPEKAQKLIEAFMPGALTLLLDRADCIPDVVTAGSGSVAVRIPDNGIARRLIELSGRPVVVPSANTTDKPSPTLAEHVAADLDGKIRYILDGGASDIGIESTIVDVRTEPPTVIRAGGVTVEEIEKVIGKVVLKRENVRKSAAFTPEAEVLFSAFYEGMADNIRSKYDSLTERGVRTVIMCLDSNKAVYGDRDVFTVGEDYNDYAHNLFALLRKADAEHYGAVIAEGVDPRGIGGSLIARLIKLSGGLII